MEGDIAETLDKRIPLVEEWNVYKKLVAAVSANDKYP
jgi:hypothetical protein